MSGESYVAIAKAASAMLAIALSAMATAYAQSKIGAAGAGAMAEKPEVAGTVFILVAIPDTMVVLGFALALMILILI